MTSVNEQSWYQNGLWEQNSTANESNIFNDFISSFTECSKSVEQIVRKTRPNDPNVTKTLSYHIDNCKQYLDLTNSLSKCAKNENILCYCETILIIDNTFMVYILDDNLDNLQTFIKHTTPLILFLVKMSKTEGFKQFHLKLDEFFYRLRLIINCLICFIILLLPQFIAYVITKYIFYFDKLLQFYRYISSIFLKLFVKLKKKYLPDLRQFP